MFGGVLGVGLAVLGALFNTFIIVVLTMYFLAVAAEDQVTRCTAWPRPRAATGSRALGDQIFRNIGGYVSGAFVVAMCAGISSLVFLFAVGLASTPSRWRSWSRCST